MAFREIRVSVFYTNTQYACGHEPSIDIMLFPNFPVLTLFLHIFYDQFIGKAAYKTIVHKTCLKAID